MKSAELGPFIDMHKSPDCFGYLHEAGALEHCTILTLLGILGGQLCEIHCADVETEPWRLGHLPQVRTGS